MKKLLFIFAIVFNSLLAFPQNDVTKFLGIPVDGTKSAMIQKLRGKGFTYHQTGDYLSGKFNGYSVNVHVVTNNKKVYRIFVEDAVSCNEADIKIRFNQLVRQFEKSNNYNHDFGANQSISEDEDISYQMSVNSKRYEASFFQAMNISSQDSLELSIKLRTYLLTKYSKEELADTAGTAWNLAFIDTMKYYYDIYSKKTVWFMISESWGNYKILMYYDNKKNQSDGEDL